MTFPLRALRVFVPLLVLAPLPIAAQQGAAPSPAQIQAPAITAAVPRYARPDDPWIYRGTDIPVDREWLFGELPNGLRYAVRHNGVPPGQVSIRVRIDAGSLHERESERGFAHLLEHMTFRQSKYLGDGEAIPYFQRLGASLGYDTNALTTPTQTVYKLDLPNAQPATIEDSIKLFSGMIREPTLSAANIAADLPIVLAERRDGGGAEERIRDATQKVLYAGQPLAERMPIGTVATLQAATPESVRAFHSRWYRPDKAVVVIVGDADPMVLAALVERYFGDWKGPANPAPDPDFGEPRAPRGADAANPVGETKIIVEPGQPRTLTYAVLRPWHEVTDNIEYNRGLLIDAVAEAIVNRRLEERARSGGSFLFAGVEQQKISRSADATYVSVAPLTGDWRTALTDARSVIADAVAEPPSQAEIDRELAEFDVVFANMVEQSRIQAGAKLADDIVNAVDIREAVASPETILEVFRAMRSRFTPQEVHEHTRALFAGDVVRGVLLTPEAGDADDAALRTALLAKVDGDGASRGSDKALTFAELPPIGTPVTPSVREPLGVFDTVADVEKVTFPNGVQALLWRTDNEPGRATVRVRFGSGLAGFSRDEAVYAQLGEIALVSTGMDSLNQSDLDRLTAGRKLSMGFRIDDGTFVFEGLTRAEDVADQLYLFAAKLAMPRWDAAPIERAKATALLSYDSYDGNPNGVINRDLEWLLHGKDPRYGTPGPDALRQASPEGFQKVWSRLLAQGPVEVDVFGDFDRETVVQALSRTFGALPARAPAPAAAQPESSFPVAGAEPTVLRHRGDADQAAAVVAWPTGGGSAALPEARKLEVLAQVFSNRLLDQLRERTGAAYSPYVGSTWPLDVPDGGNILALVQLPPEQVPTFFTMADQIAEDLSTTGPTADELSRVTEPLRQLFTRAQTGHTFWLNQLQGASFDHNRLAYLGSLMADYTRVTPEQMRALAARYLGSKGGWKLAVLPEPAGAQAGR